MTQKLGLWADIQHISKSSSNWHVNQDWCETSGNCYREWPKPWIFIYFGAQKLDLWGPYSTRLKVLAMSMWSNTDVKPAKTFWESGQSPEFLLTLGSKMAQKLGLWGPYCTHFGAQKLDLWGPYSTRLKVLAMSMWSNTDVKPAKTFWESGQSPEFLLTLGSKMAQKLDLWGPYCTHLWK